jgi:plastocyanin
MHLRSILLVALLLVAACGSDATPDDPSPEITVFMDDFSFSPAEIRAAEGAEISLEVRNVGDVVHSWVLLDVGVDVATLAEYDESMALVYLEADEGAIDAATFSVPPPGTYQVICTITGHLSSGMQGTLTVG